MTEIEILARTLYGEAETNDREDAVAIAHVVMNRVAYPNWPNTISEVCLQPWQFSCWNADNPRLVKIKTDKPQHQPWLQDCFDIASACVNGIFQDPTNGATHYYASYLKDTPKWAKGHTPCYVDKWGRYQHRYFNDIDTPPPTTPVEALDQDRPLGSTRTMQGVRTGGAGIAALAVAETVQEAASGIQPLVPYLDAMKWVFIALTIVGLVVVGWARIDDRRKGRR